MNEAAKEKNLGISQITLAISNIDKSTQTKLKKIYQYGHLVADLQAQSKNILVLSSRLKNMAYGHRDNSNWEYQKNERQVIKSEVRSRSHLSMVNSNNENIGNILDEYDELTEDPSNKSKEAS